MRIIKLNQELFDGQEENWINFEGELTVEENKVKVHFDDFYKNDFYKLKDFLPTNKLDDLIKELDLRPIDKVFYKDKNGLSVVYCQKEIKENKDCLIILSFGESQPTRYRIFALGVGIMD